MADQCPHFPAAAVSQFWGPLQSVPVFLVSTEGSTPDRTITTIVNSSSTRATWTVNSFIAIMCALWLSLRALNAKALASRSKKLISPEHSLSTTLSNAPRVVPLSV
jgi:hypothetical protein